MIFLQYATLQLKYLFLLYKWMWVRSFCFFCDLSFFSVVAGSTASSVVGLCLGLRRCWNPAHHHSLDAVQVEPVEVQAGTRTRELRTGKNLILIRILSNGLMELKLNFQKSQWNIEFGYGFFLVKTLFLRKYRIIFLFSLTSKWKYLKIDKLHAEVFLLIALLMIFFPVGDCKVDDACSGLPPCRWFVVLFSPENV